MEANRPPTRRSNRLAAVVVALASSGLAEPFEAAPPDPSAAIVLVVSSESPVTELPRLHLADLYLGRTTRFPNGEPAKPIDQQPGSPVWEEFYSEYLGRTPAEIKAHWSKIIFTGRGRPPKEVDGSEQVRELVAGDATAIGYLERRWVNDSVTIVQVR